MTAEMTQDERLDILIDDFGRDEGIRADLKEKSTGDKARAFRALMNVRMPGELPPETVRVQNEYLREVARKKGEVSLDEIERLTDPGLAAGDDILSLWKGDITRLKVDAIVNAANSGMLGCFVPGHNCIDNCIHSFAGFQLREECARNMAKLRHKFGEGYEQPTAVPMLTDAYNLPCEKVIHIVGPIASGRITPRLEQELADCYVNTLDLCKENMLKTVAICAISTGVFGFPKERAAEIAVRETAKWLDSNKGVMDRVIFCVHSDFDKEIYEKVLGVR